MIFRKKKEEANKGVKESHLKNLMVLAMADGHMSEIENHLLLSIAHRLGLNDSDIAKINNEINEISFVLPARYEDRIEQFEDLLNLMAIDGHIDPNEEEVCRQMAKKYELMASVVEDMIARYR